MLLFSTTWCFLLFPSQKFLSVSDFEKKSESGAIQQHDVNFNSDFHSFWKEFCHPQHFLRVTSKKTPCILQPVFGTFTLPAVLLKNSDHFS